MKVPQYSILLQAIKFYIGSNQTLVMLLQVGVFFFFFFLLQILRDFSMMVHGDQVLSFYWWVVCHGNDIPQFRFSSLFQRCFPFYWQLCPVTWVTPDSSCRWCEQFHTCFHLLTIDSTSSYRKACCRHRLSSGGVKLTLSKTPAQSLRDGDSCSLLLHRHFRYTLYAKVR